MLASFRGCGVAIVWAVLMCSSAVNGQTRDTWLEYISARQAQCISYYGYPCCDNGECYPPWYGQVCSQFENVYRICFSTQTSLCGTQCYQSTLTSPYTCFNFGGMLAAFPAGYQMCQNYQGYNPQTQQCMNNSGVFMVCPFGWEICGTQCYDPSASTCISTFGVPIVCPYGYKLCNSGECYDPTNQNCFSYIVPRGSKIYKVCQINNKLCGDQCYHPKLDTCLNPVMTSKSCAANKLVCNTYSGAACYDPLLQNCTKLQSGFSILCDTNNLVCMVNRGNSNSNSDLLQGQCYDPATHACVTDGPYTLICPITSKTCNNQCYSEISNVCLTAEGDYPMLCPINNQLCGTVRGPKCYDPNIQLCSSNGNFTIVCNKLTPNVCPNGACCG